MNKNGFKTQSFRFSGALMHSLICQDQAVLSRVQAGKLIWGFETTLRKLNKGICYA
jgi:hypothetical protein